MDNFYLFNNPPWPSDRCPICKQNTIFEGSSLVAGIEIRGLYDGVAYWTCRICKDSWNRFPSSDRITKEVIHMMKKSGFEVLKEGSLQ